MSSVCLSVVCSGKSDVCGVTVSLYPHRENQKICFTTAIMEPMDLPLSTELRGQDGSSM